MKIRNYTPADCQEMATLFYNTVHTVNLSHYTPQQCNAWANGHVDLAAWNQSFLVHTTLIAQEMGIIIGFADMDASGYLDRLYVHKDYQSQGVATALCRRLEQLVSSQRYTTHASITARPFFEHMGYRVIKEQQVCRHGVWLTNFVMEKTK